MAYSYIITNANLETRKSVKGERFILISLFCLMMLIVCSLLSAYYFFSYIAIGVALLFLYAVYRFRPGYYIKYLAFVFSFAAASMGVFVIEFFPLYLMELRVDSSYTGSLPLLLFSYVFFSLVLIIFDEKKLTEREMKKEILKKDAKLPQYMIWLTYITIFIYAFFFARVFTKPAFLLKVNRFGYAQNYMPKTTGILGILSNQLMLLSFFPIIAFIKGHRNIGLIGVGLYALYNLWTGNKFGPFFSMLLVLLLLSYPRISAKKSKKIRKILFRVIIAVAIVVVAALIIENILGGTISNYTLFRFSGQGEMWWGAYKDFRGTIHLSEFSDEINGLFFGKSSVADNVGSSYGIYKLMYLIAPRSVIDSKLASGSRYTESGFACAYYYLGALGCVLFALVIGFAITRILNGFIEMIREERYLRALIFLRFFILMRESQSMFIFLEFIDPLSILSYIMLLLSYKKRYYITTKNGRQLVF